MGEVATEIRLDSEGGEKRGIHLSAVKTKGMILSKIAIGDSGHGGEFGKRSLAVPQSKIIVR